MNSGNSRGILFPRLENLENLKFHSNPPGTSDLAFAKIIFVELPNFTSFVMRKILYEKKTILNFSLGLKITCKSRKSLLQSPNNPVFCIVLGSYSLVILSIIKSDVKYWVFMNP